MAKVESRKPQGKLICYVLLRAPNMPMRHHHVPVYVCMVFIKWKIQTNPFTPTRTSPVKQRVKTTV
jgi:hypothetical protein